MRLRSRRPRPAPAWFGIGDDMQRSVRAIDQAESSGPVQVRDPDRRPVGERDGPERHGRRASVDAVEPLVVEGHRARAARSGPRCPAGATSASTPVAGSSRISVRPSWRTSSRSASPSSAGRPVDRAGPGSRGSPRRSGPWFRSNSVTVRRSVTSSDVVVVDRAAGARSSCSSSARGVRRPGGPSSVSSTRSWLGLSDLEHDPLGADPEVAD